MADEAKLPQICQVLGLAPDTPPEKIREAVAALRPGPVIDELACRSVGIHPVLWEHHFRAYADGETIVELSGRHDGDAADFLLRRKVGREATTAWYFVETRPGSWLPVSSEPTAAHELAMAALEAGLGWPIVVSGAAGFNAFIQRTNHRAPGSTPMHAAALAVALTGLERMGS